jgi:hypothetical protein
VLPVVGLVGDALLAAGALRGLRGGSSPTAPENVGGAASRNNFTQETVPWKTNETPRTEAEIPSVLERNGVTNPLEEPIRWVARPELLPATKPGEPTPYASYPQVGTKLGNTAIGKPGQPKGLADYRVEWEDHVNPNTGKIPIRLDPKLLVTDEGIAAVGAHELFELDLLNRVLQTEGSISLAEYNELVRADRPDNLHHYAVRHGDNVVKMMRGELTSLPDLATEALSKAYEILRGTAR